MKRRNFYLIVLALLILGASGLLTCCYFAWGAADKTPYMAEARYCWIFSLLGLVVLMFWKNYHENKKKKCENLKKSYDDRLGKIEKEIDVLKQMKLYLEDNDTKPSVQDLLNLAEKTRVKKYEKSEDKKSLLLVEEAVPTEVQHFIIENFPKL